MPSSSAQELDRASLETADAPLYYLFQAEQLGFPSGLVSARFEYRSSDHVLGSDTVRLSFDNSSSQVVPLPTGIWSRLLQSGQEDLRLVVFADDLLLADLDREALLSYNRVLSYTRADELGSRSVPLKIQCNSPCSGGCGPYDDYDCDGVNNITDNCTDDANSNQADCDSDGLGDVCDYLDATYAPSGSVDTCMTDKDNHVSYFTFEHHVEQLQVDTSSCGAPNIWNRWVREDNDCFNISDYDCCYGLRFSLADVGDSYGYWCSTSYRNVDFCH